MNNKFLEAMRELFPDSGDLMETNKELHKALVATFCLGYGSGVSDAGDKILEQSTRMTMSEMDKKGWYPDDSWAWWK